MNNEYYYIKLKSINYDEPDWFLVDADSLSPNEWVSPTPKGITIFDDLDKAIDAKIRLKEYFFKDYIVEIVRF